MTTAVRPSFTFDNTYVRDLEGLYERWSGAAAPDPRVIALNEPLARKLGLDPDALRTEEGVGVLVGTVVPEGAEPIAQAYAGHQFGGYSPRLGDGRALLVGELLDPHGGRHDLHLKGSGRTRFARGGDGKAPLGPMLREYVVGEAMHALRIPTTRALSVAGTGEMIMRDRGPEPGAVLARIASSHIRVGTFQYAAATGDADLLRRLADHAIDRHHPDARDADDPYLAFYERVVEAQAHLVAQWMLVGFVHGVMNTDNMTISGETIDYGPCAFLDGFDPAAVYSSIDEGGRYAFGNQPVVAAWNLARFAETLIPLIEGDTDAAIASATEVLQSFADRHDAHWRAGMRAKLGLDRDAPEDPS
ncbi:MAG: YdiU family protein, partial [Actinomycetota bacterium]|nr:YdiU family protein [Actinomycetota bacterium]